MEIRRIRRDIEGQKVGIAYNMQITWSFSLLFRQPHCSINIKKISERSEEPLSNEFELHKLHNCTNLLHLPDLNIPPRHFKGPSVSDTMHLQTDESFRVCFIDFFINEIRNHFSI